MTRIVKTTLAAALLAGAAAMVPTVSIAGVGVSVGIGVPLVYAPGPGYSPYQGQLYYDPIYFDGAWYHGPYRWRVRHGVRVFWVNGRWHRNEWYGRPIPASLTFRNGGYLRSGRYDGFEGAERINARFTSNRRMEHDDRPDMRSDRGDMREDRGPNAPPAPDNARRNEPRPPHN
jgi:hypothetical protein